VREGLPVGEDKTRRESPRLSKAGWPRQLRKAAKRPLKERTGRLPQKFLWKLLNRPVCAGSKGT
jgi:hypothetical protein